MKSFEKIGLFVGGIVFGAITNKVLQSEDAKKVYTHTTAATLRAKNSVMKSVTKVKEEADDILAKAKDINEDRLLKQERDAGEIK